MAGSPQLTITDNAIPGEQTVSLSGTGTVPVVNLSPSSLIFQSTTVGTKAAVQDVKLINNGLGAAGLSNFIDREAHLRNRNRCQLLLSNQ